MKTTAQHKKFWAERQIDWEKDYFSTWSHPHRRLILEAVRQSGAKSLLEIGCASGPNLYVIKKTFPFMKLGGVDINSDAIDTAKRILGDDVILDNKSIEDIFFSDKSVDVTLSDMCLIYIGRDRIKRVMNEVTRVTRNGIILCEFHSESWTKRLGLKFASGYNAYDYRRLLEKYDFYDIEVKKIDERDWPGGEPQKTFGYIVTAKL